MIQELPSGPQKGHRATRLVAAAWHMDAVLVVDHLAQRSTEPGQLRVRGRDVWIV